MKQFTREGTKKMTIRKSDFKTFLLIKVIFGNLSFFGCFCKANL
jgi:hypothetical protein